MTGLGMSDTVEPTVISAPPCLVRCGTAALQPWTTPK